MQHPVGYKLSHGQAQLNNVWALFVNPTFVWGYAHVVLASLITGSLVMLAVSAWYLRKGAHVESFRHTAKVALLVLIPAIVIQMSVGNQLGVIENEYQPMKIAAAEAQWNSCQPCSFSAFQFGGGASDQTPVEIIPIPHLLSVLATGTWNGAVTGLNQLQAQYQRSTGPATTSPTCSSSTGRCGSWPTWPASSCCSLCGAAGCSPGDARAIAAVLDGRHLGGDHAVPDEHGRVVFDRERPAAMDRAGATEDRRAPALPRSARPRSGSA